MRNSQEFVDDYARGLNALGGYSRPFHSLALSLGVPVEDSGEGVTAFVSFNADEKQVEFHMNPDFIHPMEDEQIGYLIAHETYHVILSHLQEAMSGEYENVSALTIAHECLVNDSVDAVIGLDSPEGGVHGIEMFGTDFSILSTREGYEVVLAAQDEDADGSVGDVSGSGGDDSGDVGSDGSEGSEGDSANVVMCSGVTVSSEDAAALQDVVISGIIEADIYDEDDSVSTQLADAISDIDPSLSGGFSLGKGEGSESLGIIDDINLNWKELLALINPKIMSGGSKPKKTTWNRPRRTAMGIYPDTILPVMSIGSKRDDDGNEVPAVVLALDLSTSIPDRFIQGLKSMAATMPDNLFRKFPVTWSSALVEFDESERVCGRYGTDVGLVWEYAKKIEHECGVTPYVVVITDGVFVSPNEMRSEKNSDEIFQRWFWGRIPQGNNGFYRTILLGDEYTPRYVNMDHVFNIDDMLS